RIGDGSVRRRLPDIGDLEGALLGLGEAQNLEAVGVLEVVGLAEHALRVAGAVAQAHHPDAAARAEPVPEMRALAEQAPVRFAIRARLEAAPRFTRFEPCIANLPSH